MKLSGLLGVAMIAPMISLSAQSSRVLAARVPVMVALVEEGRFGQDAVVLRRGAPEARNVIVLSRAATPYHLAAAAVALASVMDREGDVPTTSTMFAVDGDANGLGNEIPAATRVLGRLRGAAVSNVVEIGTARTTVIYLPNAVERRRLERSGKARFVTRRGTTGP